VGLGTRRLPVSYVIIKQKGERLRAADPYPQPTIPHGDALKKTLVFLGKEA